MIYKILTCLATISFIVALAACKGQSSQNSENTTIDSARICKIQFNGDSALAYVKAQCNFGARTPNSEAIERCGDYLVAQFRNAGLSVEEQRTILKGWDGTDLKCRNIIASYKPDLSERIIIAAHYDCRPWSDHDPDSTKHRQPVMGANDGASGIAVMLELARHIAQLNPKVGVDFICFDTEDYGAPYWAPAEAQQRPDVWCLGSQYWARHPHKAGYTARYGILLDMVGGKGSKFLFEGYSLKYAQSQLVRTWEAAKLAGAGDYFITDEGGFITDDHVPVNEIAGIPMIDIIPFDPDGGFCQQWHTTADTPDAIDPATLRAVGQTLLQVLSEEQ